MKDSNIISLVDEPITLIKTVQDYKSISDIREQYALAIKTYEFRKRFYPLEFFKPYEHQKTFRKIIDDDIYKLIWIFGGNRSGKTENGAEYMVRSIIDKPNIDTWACTWADLSIPVQQQKVYNFLPKFNKSLIEYASFSEQGGFTHRLIKSAKGSILRFKTYDQGWESFQGAGKHIIWNDEEQPQDIYREQLARLIDSNGVMLTTMTPLNGLTYTYDEVIRNIRNNKMIWYDVWNTKDNKSLNLEVIDNIMGSYSDKEAEVRTTGKFINLKSGVMYYAFTDELNVVKKSPFGKELFLNIPIEVSCDFNVNFMHWSLGQCINGIDYEFDSVTLHNRASTEEMCRQIKRKYSKHPAGYIFYTDIAGKKGSTVVSYSDINVIEKEFKGMGAGSDFIHYQAIKNVGDRVTSSNARFKNAKGEVKCIINELTNAPLVTDLRRLTWEIFLSESKRQSNPELTHPTDGLSYKLFWKYPPYLDFSEAGKIYR
jgi:phage terminase large subunit-like protein